MLPHLRCALGHGAGTQSRAVPPHLRCARELLQHRPVLPPGAHPSPGNNKFRATCALKGGSFDPGVWPAARKGPARTGGSGRLRTGPGCSPWLLGLSSVQPSTGGSESVVGLEEAALGHRGFVPRQRVGEGRWMPRGCQPRSTEQTPASVPAPVTQHPCVPVLKCVAAFLFADKTGYKNHELNKTDQKTTQNLNQGGKKQKKPTVNQGQKAKKKPKPKPTNEQNQTKINPHGTEK